MTTTVALYQPSHDAVRDRLAALGLDIDLITFDADGVLRAGGETFAPGDCDVDYLWFGPEISRDGVFPKAVEIALGLKSLKLLQTFNAGLDHPAYKTIAARGTRICNSSAQGIAIAEYVFAQVMAVFHPIGQQRDLQATTTWQKLPFREIAGSTWVVVGFGPIGRAIVSRAKAFDATVHVVRKSGVAALPADSTTTLDGLGELLPDADVIVIACPLTPDTRGLADAAFFKAVKPGATLVNIARGAIIDDGALLASLDDGNLGTAVLDVFHTEPLPADDPLWTHPGVRLTAHSSFNGSGTQGRWHQLFLDNLPRFSRGEPLENEVDASSL